MYSKKGTANINLVGTLKKPKNFEKKEMKSPSGWEGLTFQLNLDCGRFGTHYIKIFGGDMRKMKTNKEGKRVLGFEPRTIKEGKGEEQTTYDVSYEERFKKDILSRVKGFYKNTVQNDDETHEFLFATDFCNYIYDNIDKLVGKKFKVTGSFNLNYGSQKDTVYQEIAVKNMYEVAEDVKEQAKIEAQVFYTKEAIPEAFFEGRKLNVPFLKDNDDKITIKAYMEQRNQDKATKKDYESLLIPIDLTLNTSKIDFTNPKMVRVANYLTNNFHITTEEVFTSTYEFDLINTQEQIEYTPEQLAELLTDEEKEYIEVFGADANEVLAKKQNKTVYGDRIKEVRVVKPTSDIPVKTKSDEISVDMLELYKVLAPKAKEETPKTAAPKTEEPANEEADLFDQCFGA